MIIDLLPEGPLYYPENQITDQMEALLSPKLLEKVLLKYQKSSTQYCGGCR